MGWSWDWGGVRWRASSPQSGGRCWWTAGRLLPNNTQACPQGDVLWAGCGSTEPGPVLCWGSNPHPSPSDSWTVTPRLLQGKTKEKEQCQRESSKQRPKATAESLAILKLKIVQSFSKRAETGGKGGRRSMEWPWLGGHIKKSWLFYEHTRAPLGCAKQVSGVRFNTRLSSGQTFPPGMW